MARPVTNSKAGMGKRRGPRAASAPRAARRFWWTRPRTVLDILPVDDKQYSQGRLAEGKVYASLLTALPRNEPGSKFDHAAHCMALAAVELSGRRQQLCRRTSVSKLKGGFHDWVSEGGIWPSWHGPREGERWIRGRVRGREGQK
jgi:hypothetical protein